ncbi:MAG: glycoside hydrolase family 3 N-terminal domain-containing protein [Propionibacteriaceae bacterium]|nr:glycoside hydrolase family 3 N-terminal domain-containing protein [Propionibacteriaceae bacterium]
MFTEEQIPTIIARLTLEEKTSLLSGSDFWHTEPIERLGIPALMVADGPHGLRKQAAPDDDLGVDASVPATCFPTAAALASTWNPELLEEVGRALGREAKAQGVGVILGPGVNLKRSPLCGRNFEYFSEDPLLAAELGAALVTGVQAEGVGTSVKHFAANNQESDRMRVNAEIDERTLREVYLAVFERVVAKAHPSTLMCSYNRINGAYSSENPWLLTHVLRDEWGFDGLVMTDWGAVNDRVAGVSAGLDLEMPSSRGINDRIVAAAVIEGRLAETDVDLAVARVLRLVARHGALPSSIIDEDAHHALAARVAVCGAVLLKNEDVLPLTTLDDAVVIGEFARTPRYQGAGSSQVNPTRLDSALDALRRRHPSLPFEPGYRLAEVPEPESSDEALRTAAAQAAAGKQALVFLGLPPVDESEGYDRRHIALPSSHIELLRAVRQTASRVVVLLANGSAVETATWERDADAILELWLGGQAGGEGAARLITGEDSPAGRLAETIPAHLGQHPAQLNFPGEAGQVRYGEGLFIGYRGLQRLRHRPSYPFGHGLTYTTFEFTDLTTSLSPISGDTALTDVVLTVGCAVTNAGPRPGVAVPQLYLGYRDSLVARPPRELRGFARLELDPGETAQAEFQVTRRDLSYWDPYTHAWQVEPGVVRIELGESCEDIVASVEQELIAPSVFPPLTEWSTLSEWRRHPEAWTKMAPLLGSYGEALADNDDPMSFFLRDLPACKVPLMFDDSIGTEQLAALVAEFGG